MGRKLIVTRHSARFVNGHTPIFTIGRLAWVAVYK